MKKGFTIIEVSILFVIFLIVALLVAPLSLDDSLQAKNAQRWKNVQSDFANIIESVNLKMSQDDYNFNKAFDSLMETEVKNDIDTYKVSFLNTSSPTYQYDFDKFKLTHTNSTLSYKLYDLPQEGNILGVLMYDVNGQVGPNVWGKDIFGLNIYKDRFEPFCKNDPIEIQKKDCSRQGTGLCCSNYYLIGGRIN